MKWPKEHIALFRKLAGAGCETVEIMECFPGRSRDSVHGLARRLGLSLETKCQEPDWVTAEKYLELRKG